MVGIVELLEIHDVVQHLTCVIEYGAFGTFHDFGQRHVFQAAAGKEFVKVVHIGFQVFAVVKQQSFLAYNIAQSAVRQLWHFKNSVVGS